MERIEESRINIISQDTRIDGKSHFTDVSRVYGTLTGEVHAVEGSKLIIGETGVIEGVVRADTLFVDGFIRGDVYAKTLVQISGTGRVIGNIYAGKLKLEFGSYFEGRCRMEEPITADLQPAPA
ncbi:MAG: polymer-forming cytoskeletal protein [Bacteriovoracia bacterium]